jgi:hypothetical protein
VTTLALRLFLAPAFVVAISLVARRYGARAGGVVGGLPVIAGPILLVLALDKGNRFAADAAVGTTFGIVALISFVLAYVALSRRRRWPVAILGSWCTFFVVLGTLKTIDAGAWLAIASACAACSIGLIVLPKPDPGRRQAAHPRHDLVFRAAAAAVPVLLVTGLASTMGARTAGLLASFPIITPVVAAFTQARHGPDEAARLLYGFTLGFFSYAIFCFVIAIALRPLGIASAFPIAAAVALAVQAIAVAVTWRAERAIPSELVEA